MLADKPEVWTDFCGSSYLVAVHCGKHEATIKGKLRENIDKSFGEDVPIDYHPEIRSEKACIKSSAMASEFGVKRHGRRLPYCIIGGERCGTGWINKGGCGRGKIIPER